MAPRRYWRGRQVSCYDCHNGPADSRPQHASAGHGAECSAPTPSAARRGHAPAGLNTGAAALTFRIVSQPAHGSVGVSNHGDVLPRARLRRYGHLHLRRWERLHRLQPRHRHGERGARAVLRLRRGARAAELACGLAGTVHRRGHTRQHHGDADLRMGLRGRHAAQHGCSRQPCLRGARHLLLVGGDSGFDGSNYHFGFHRHR